MDPTIIVSILKIVLAAEPAVVNAIHNILTGNGSTDDLAVLGADKIAWQTIADKAAAEIAKVKTLTPVQAGIIA